MVQFTEGGGGGGNPNKQTKKNKIQTYKIRKDSFQLDL